MENNEKGKVFIHRLIWLIIIVLIIFIPVIANAVQPELEIVSDEGYIQDYYSSLDETSVKLYITFNREVYSGYATIKYFDDSNNLLERSRCYFTAYGKEAESWSEYVNGHVSSYEIVSYEFDTVFTMGWIYSFLLPALIMFIGSLLLNYKEYQYNGIKISIYAGWYHHTLRVNGEICDEHNTVVSYIPINLSTTVNNDMELDATISLTNRISLKVNNKLIAKQKNNIS